MALPHDFRALGKAPMPPPGQGGNPLQISGNKLQENFEYLDKKQADILPGGGGLPDGLIHQWKTTRNTDTTIDVRGGTLTSQSGFAQADIASVAGLGVASSGYAMLTVTRDDSTRNVTATVISYNAGEPPASTYEFQYIPLAKITFADDAIVEIEQRRFEEINILEDLAVVNGEFMLADLLIASRNIYELPPS